MWVSPAALDHRLPGAGKQCLTLPTVVVKLWKPALPQSEMAFVFGEQVHWTVIIFNYWSPWFIGYSCEMSSGRQYEDTGASLYPEGTANL